MAIDMDMMVKVKNLPTEKVLRELQYNLMQRFGFHLFFDPEKRSEHKPFVKVAKLNDGKYAIVLNLRSRLYAKGYERGDGLNGAMILLFLIRAFPEGEVWYGTDGLEEYGEDLLEPYDEQKAIKLLNHFVDVGKMPMLREMDEAMNSEDGTTSPSCSFCRMPMIRNSKSSEYASFYCAGCGEALELRGKGHKKWLKHHRRRSVNQSNECHELLEDPYDHPSSAQNAAGSDRSGKKEDSTEQKLARRRLSDWLEIYLSSQVGAIGNGAISIPSSFKVRHDEIRK